MSTLFRMLFVNSGRTHCCRAAASTHHLKLNVVVMTECSLVVSSCKRRCKALQFTPLVASSTSYSTQADAQTSERKSKKSTSTVVNANEKEVIYTGLLTKNIRNIKLFSLSTSIISLAIQPIVYQRAVLAGTMTKFTLPVFALIGLFALATPPLLHMIAKRYVLSVEYDCTKDMYTATTYNLLCMQKKVEFTPEDVTIPTVLGMFTTCAIKGKPVFLDAKSFTDQNHYIRIMGYDKPVDLQVQDVHSNENCSKRNN